MLRIGYVFNNKWRSSDVQREEDINFENLQLSDNVLHGLKSSGFVWPSPIQFKAIPLGRSGLDLILQAKSGTGKTCVFAVIALEKLLLESRAVQALILAPTREVALQISQVIRGLGVGFKGLQCHTYIGGMPLDNDKSRVKKCQIAVGTPGRIKHLIKDDILKTNSIRLFVLDEADKLLAEDFQETVNWIYSSLPVRKQMLAVSATYPEELVQQLQLYMRNPTVIRLNTEKPSLKGVAQFYTTTPYNPVQHISFQSKINMLLKILKSVGFSQCLVFSNYQTRAESICDILKKKGWPTAYISGGQEQSQRLRAIDDFREFKCRVFVSTDVTSRGLDVENVNLVVNIDVPWEVETYLHRIGRAGRFGTCGLSITIISGEEETTRFDKIKENGKIDISVLPDPLPDCLWTYATPHIEPYEVFKVLNDNAQHAESSQTTNEDENSNQASSENTDNHDVASETNNHDIKSKPETQNESDSVPVQKPETDSSQLQTRAGKNASPISSLKVDPKLQNNNVSKVHNKVELSEPRFSQPVGYEELMDDFGKSLEEVSNEDKPDEPVDNDMLLELNSFLHSSHEAYQLKLKDELAKCCKDSASLEHSLQTKFKLQEVCTENVSDDQELDSEMQSLLDLNSFLHSSHEDYQSKFQDELSKCCEEDDSCDEEELALQHELAICSAAALIRHEEFESKLHHEVPKCAEDLNDRDKESSSKAEHEFAKCGHNESQSDAAYEYARWAEGALDSLDESQSNSEHEFAEQAEDIHNRHKKAQSDLEHEFEWKAEDAFDRQKELKFDLENEFARQTEDVMDRQKELKFDLENELGRQAEEVIDRRKKSQSDVEHELARRAKDALVRYVDSESQIQDELAKWAADAIDRHEEANLKIQHELQQLYFDHIKKKEELSLKIQAELAKNCDDNEDIIDHEEQSQNQPGNIVINSKLSAPENIANPDIGLTTEPCKRDEKTNLKSNCVFSVVQSSSTYFECQKNVVSPVSKNIIDVEELIKAAASSDLYLNHNNSNSDLHTLATCNEQTVSDLEDKSKEVGEVQPTLKKTVLTKTDTNRPSSLSRPEQKLMNNTLRSSQGMITKSVNPQLQDKTSRKNNIKDIKINQGQKSNGQYKSSMRKFTYTCSSSSSDDESSSEYENSSDNSELFNTSVISARQVDPRCASSYETMLRSWWRPNTRMAVTYRECQNVMSSLRHAYRRDAANGVI